MQIKDRDTVSAIHVVTDRQLQFMLFFPLPLGLVAFRQHLQNLARTKGILELNKVYEQMGSGENPSLGPFSPQTHPHDLLDPLLQVSPPHMDPRHGWLFPYRS